MQPATCDCPRSRTMLYFCIQNNCDNFRRLCYQCHQQHNQQHMILPLYDPQSLSRYSIFKNDPNKNLLSLILKNMKTDVQTLIEKITIDLKSILEEFNKIYKDSFLREISELEKACDQKNQEQKWKIILSKESTRQQLSLIALQISALKSSRFNNKNTIFRLAEETKDNCAIISQNFSQVYQKLLGIANELKQLTPFSERWNYINTKYLRQEQKKNEENQRKLFIIKYGSIIGKLSDTLVDYQQWSQKNQSLQSVKQLCLNMKNLEAIPHQISLFKHLKYLNLGQNQIKQIKNLEKLKELQNIRLTNNQIKKIENLENLPKLSSISLSGNPMEQDQEFKRLTKQLKKKNVTVFF